MGLFDNGDGHFRLRRFFFKQIPEKWEPKTQVYYYGAWSFDTDKGLLKLKKPLGPYPPNSGAYTTCFFALNSWKDFLDAQPSLCTSFDAQGRIAMYLNDHDIESGIVREIHFNRFEVPRRSLLGEPLNRSALRLGFRSKGTGIHPHFQRQNIYQAFEREVMPGRFQIVETFTRTAQGKIQSLTESVLVPFTSDDLYAEYNDQGALVKAPTNSGQNYSFPAKIEIKNQIELKLPRKIRSESPYAD